MSREMRRCTVTDEVFSDGRKHGYGCPHHTELEDNGGKQTQTQLLNYYHDRRSEYPHGRYCCAFCRVHQEVKTVPDYSSPTVASTASGQGALRQRNGSVGVALFGTLILAGVFAANEWPWVVGGIVGAAAGYWWRTVLKVAVAIAVIGAVIATAFALFAYAS